MALLLLLVAGAGCGRMWPGRFGQNASVQAPPLSSLTVNVGEFVAGTAEQANLTVSLIDDQGQAVAGVTPVLGVSGSLNTVNCSPSNLAGSATCTVSSTVAESKTVSLVSPPLNAASVVVTALPANSFRYVWKAQNTATLPLVLGRSYNFTVYWGDGTSDQITSPLDSDRTHTYASPGDKSITLVGTFDHFQFATNPERLLDVTRWGSTTWRSMNGMFKNATNLVSFSATDVPDTSAVSDFSEIFMGATSFNGDVTQWNTAAATDMRRMFRGAVAFNQDISSKVGDVWNVSSVWDFSEMFSADISDFTVLNTPVYTRMAFNQNLSNWLTNSAGNFSKMFAGCESFNQNVGTWNTTSVTDMSFMFMHAKVFNSNLAWDVSNVTTFEGMFQGATAFNEDIQAWNTGSVTNLKRMFANASAFNQDIRDWNTSQVESLYETFYGASAFNHYIGIWIVHSNRSLYRTFAGAASFNRNLSAWDTSSVTDMHGTFMNATAFNNGGSPLSWNTALVTRTSNMFAGATSYNQPMDATGNRWNFANVTRMEEMFQNATAFNQDLDTWDTSAVTNMREMFSGATQFNGAVGAWDTERVTNFYAVFLGATSFDRPLTNWDISLATNVASMFYGAGNFNQSVSHMNPLSATSTSRMFLNALKFNNGGSTCGVYEPTRSLEWATSAVQNMDRMFEDAVCFNQEVNLVTDAVTSMAQMFSEAERFNRPIVPTGLYWNLSAVMDMTEMFEGAHDFNQDIHSWDVSNVRTFSRMFYNAASFNDGGAPLLWNSTSATDMDYMFARATALNVPVGLITNRVMNMDYMFSGATAFNRPIPVSAPIWDTSSVVSMRYMFFDASAFDQDISTWNVSNVTDARAFHGGSNAVGWVQAERPMFSQGAGSRRVFLTGATFNGNLGGVAGADARCQADGSRPPTGTYRALLVALGQRSVQLPGGPFNWPLQAYMQYTRADGTLVATTNLFRVFPSIPFEQAISTIGGPFWTGMNGLYSMGENCQDWAASGALAGGISSGLTAITADPVTCDQLRRLLCVEE